MADLPLSGSIDAQTFPYLVADLHRREATGSLRVEGPTYQKALYFRSGRVLFGSSNDPRDQLGSILIETGRLTAEQLDDVNSRVGPGNPLAKLLSESGLVSQRELGESARAKVERILSDLLQYEEGSYEFEDGILPKGAVDLKLSTEKLMLAAVRRIEERPFVLRHLESIEAVLHPVEGMDDAVRELRSEIGPLLDRFDGQLSIKEAAAEAASDEFDAAKVACALQFLGVLQGAGGPLAANVEPEPEDASLDLGDEASSGFDFGGGEEPMGFGPADEAHDDDPTVAIPSPSFDARADFAVAEPEPAFGFEAEPEPEPETETWQPEPEPPGAQTWQPEPEPEPAAQAWQPEPEPAASWQPEAEPIPDPADDDAPTWTPRDSEAHSSPPPPQADTTGPPASKPSREDLAALDALLNNRALEGPLEPLEKPADSNWTPQFVAGRGAGTAGAAARGGRARLRQERSPMLWVALGFVGLLCVAGAGIYWVGGPDAALERITALVDQVRGTGTTTVPPAPEPVTQPPVTQPAETPVVDAGEPPADAGAPPTDPEAAAPAAEPGAELPPATTPPAPVTEPPAPAPTIAPTTAGGAATTPPSVDAARAALRGGRFGDAGRGFAQLLRSSAPFTVQVLVACSEETLQKTISSVTGDELYILPVELQGRACFRVCWGLYQSEDEAQQGLGSVPPYFRANGSQPRVVRSETLF